MIGPIEIDLPSQPLVWEMKEVVSHFCGGPIALSRILSAGFEKDLVQRKQLDVIRPLDKR